MECHEFEIEVLPGGKVRVHIRGVKGDVCMEYVKMFEEIAGGVGQVERTAEFYEPPTGVGIRVDQKNSS